jgi:DNA-binding transcriptional LysR family regulator
MCALPEGSPLAEHEILTPALMDDHPFIVMGADHMVTRRAREAFHSDDANWLVRCHTDLFRNALNLVKQGIGAALIDPFTLAADDGTGYVTRRFAPRIMLDIVIVTARGRPLSSIGRQFLDQIVPEMEEMATAGLERD